MGLSNDRQFSLYHGNIERKRKARILYRYIGRGWMDYLTESDFLTVMLHSYSTTSTAPVLQVGLFESCVPLDVYLFTRM